MLRYVRPHAASLTLVFVLALLGAAFELARPWPLKVVVDYVLVGQALPAWLAGLAELLPYADSPRGLLLWAVVVGGVTVLGSVLTMLVVRMIIVTVAQRMVFDLSREVFARLQRLSLSFHGRHAVGDLVQRVGQDVFVVQGVLSAVALPAIVAALSLVGMFLIMSRLDLTLALVAVAVVPLMLAALAVFGRQMTASSTRQWQTQGAMMAFLQQSLSAVPAIQGFARERYVQRKLEERGDDLLDAHNQATFVSLRYNQATVLITGLGTAVLLGLGGARVLDGHLSAGDLLVFLAYLAALYAPLNSVTTSIGAGVAAVTRGRRVFEVLDSQEEVPERPQPVELIRARGEVVFDDVTFGYWQNQDEEALPVLEQISLRAEPGQITAIVGATGAGKSSLISLLVRFYDPWSGSVRIDGHDLRDLSLRSLRENVSLVLQETFLFPMSVAENIAFGRPEASRAEIVEAARAAHAHRFIERLPEGYDTQIGEKGATLSGGERQRIAIARAILKDAPILILDEPTSALDAHTEAQIFEAISHLMKNSTTFIISHRLSTIRRADQILALENGRLAEQGTHESLLAAGRVYAHLYKHQHLAAL
ncbi:ABC transporter ATP-binding protein [soil metagenome]